MKTVEQKINSIESDVKGASKTETTFGKKRDALLTLIKDILKQLTKVEKYKWLQDNIKSFTSN